jgi:hypothetical protein
MEYYGESGYAVGDGLVSLIASVLIKDGFTAAAESDSGGRFYEILYDYTFYIAVYAVGAAVLMLIAYLFYRRVKGTESESDKNDGKKAAVEDIIVFDEFGI